MTLRHLLPLTLLAATACSDVTDPDGDNEGEVITTVILTFTPTTGDVVVAEWADPEDDGDPEISGATLVEGSTYGLTIGFLNELESPAEIITDEVLEEADEHQVFLTGDLVDGPANPGNTAALVTHTYDDLDDDGLPLGVDNVMEAFATGSGDLTVTLRHLPPENGEVVKVEGLAADVAAGGFASIPGESDVSVTLPLEVVAPE